MMSIVIEFSVGTDDFRMASLLSLDPDMEVRAEQLVPLGDIVMPFLWVSGNTDAFEEKLDGNGMSYSTVVADEERNRKLYRLGWNEKDDDLIEAILKYDGSVLDVEGTHDEWRFRVRFKRQGDLSDFYEYCDRHGVSMDVRSIYSPVDFHDNLPGEMTTRQVETLVDALEEGYFEVPRETTLVELSEKYGISDQAVSERIRRATAGLIRESLLSEYPLKEAKSGG